MVPRYRLPVHQLGKFQSLVKKVVADNPDLVDQAIISPHVPGSGRQGLKSTPEWLEISTQPELIDMVEQLIGPDIILWGSALFYKRALAGPATPWHRDGFAYPIFPLETTSVWIAATDSTSENGCLRVIPGSHSARELGKHNKAGDDDLVFQDSLPDIDESKAADVELEPGQMVIFDVYTIHGAQPNLGTKERAGYSLRFMPGSCHFDHDSAVISDEPGFGHETRPLILVRGKDLTGRNDFERGHPKPADRTPVPAI